MSSTIIRIRQKGYVRSVGFQVSNWAVTVPVADPSASPLLATAPLSYAPLFVLHNAQGFDSFVRVASIADLAAIPQAEARFFDIRGPGGDAVFAGGGPVAGDVLTFPGTADRVSYWLQEGLPPYDTDQFVVLRQVFKATGTHPQLLSGNRIQLNDYSFTPNDVNRWIVIVENPASPFSNSSYRGPAQILSIAGNTATINKTITTNELGGAWQMPIIEIDPGSASLEPKFFPTAELNLAWVLSRGASVISSASYGGVTSRWRGEPESMLIRSVRYTGLEATNAAATNIISVIQNGVMNLQAAAAVNNTELTPLVTSTYGP